ncbi:MAG: 6,7-dimethyl-8-ribityllumazine synthase [Terrimicrobiaceae bacterium]
MKTAPRRPRSAFRSHCEFAIVASQYNVELTQSLVDHAYQEIEALEHGAQIQLHWAPGTFEIPVLAKVLAMQAHYDAILTFGVVIEGQTSHAQMIGQSVTQALQHIAIETGIPVIDGIIMTDDFSMARSRCMDAEKNRGVEAARAAISVARTMKSLRNA